MGISAVIRGTNAADDTGTIGTGVIDQVGILSKVTAVLGNRMRLLDISNQHHDHRD